jgi:hypothetical protein
MGWSLIVALFDTACVPVGSEELQDVIPKHKSRPKISLRQFCIQKIVLSKGSIPAGLHY